MSVHGWHTPVGKYVLALVVFVGVAGCSAGGPDLSELQPGDCISGQPYLYPPDIELIDCSEASPVTDTMVVFAEGATGESYPGNLEEMSARCAGEGGFFLEPSSETWDDGDRIGLCSTSVEMGKYRDFGQSSSSPEPDDGESEPTPAGDVSDDETESQFTAEELDASFEAKEQYVEQAVKASTVDILSTLSTTDYEVSYEHLKGMVSTDWMIAGGSPEEIKVTKGEPNEEIAEDFGIEGKTLGIHLGETSSILFNIESDEPPEDPEQIIEFMQDEDSGAEVLTAWHYAENGDAFSVDQDKLDSMDGEEIIFNLSNISDGIQETLG